MNTNLYDVLKNLENTRYYRRVRIVKNCLNSLINTLIFDKYNFDKIRNQTKNIIVAIDLLLNAMTPYDYGYAELSYFYIGFKNSLN